MDLLAAIESERLTIADTLATLTPDQWATQSCCDAWTVQEVAAHLTQGWNYSLAHGMAQMLRARGDLGKVNSRCVAPLAAAGTDAIVADLRENAASEFKPPGMGFEAPLNDLVIHRRDMFLPLGIAYESPPGVGGELTGHGDQGRHGQDGQRRQAAERDSDASRPTSTGAGATGRRSRGRRSRLRTHSGAAANHSASSAVPGSKCSAIDSLRGSTPP